MIFGSCWYDENSKEKDEENMYRRTERLELKPIRLEDKEAVIAILCDDEIKKTYMVPDFESYEQAEKLFLRLKELSERKDFYQVGIFVDDRLIGIANEVERVDKSIELGYAILPQYHNKGYGTEMLKAMIEQLLKDGFAEVITGAFEENGASIRVMEKCGMKRLEKMDEIEYRGKVHRCVYYGKSGLYNYL